MNCVDCKDFTCQHRSESTGGGSCYYESGEQKEKLLTMAAEASLHSVDWSSFRREAAKDILCAMVSHTGGNADLERVIELTDALVAKLKQE